MKTLRNLAQLSDTCRRLTGRRILRWLAVGAIGTAVIIAGAYYFDVITESDEFCGALCHPNYPEYVTHEVSDHARVECGTCHIGPGLTPKVMAKVYGVEELYLLVTNTYERPIPPPVKRLRPAREICEQCHWPAKFYTDRVLSRSTFAEDEGNSETQTYLILRTGGGERPEPNPSIHWHIENPVWYVATDAARQDIPWVGVMGDDGEMVEYWAQDTDLTPQDLAELPRREMDCLDCHNRVTHVFRQPDRSVDEALADGRMDRTLPFIKREAVKLLSVSYPTQEAGIEAMTGLAQFYSSEYPDIYAEKQQAIEEAVAVLQDIYAQTVFPSMDVTWEAYPDDIGHADFPGCFRCHDGEHLDEEGDSIRLHCNICHSIPVVTRPDQEPDLTDIITFITQAKQEPQSHLETNFIRDHRFQANESCAECHGSAEFGVDNSSFCANYACHGQEWPEVNLSTTFPHPIELVGKHAEVACNACHQGEEEPPSDDCAACHQPVSEPHFGSDCAQCHTPEGWTESASAWVTDVPLIPHPIEEATDCLQCHGEDGIRPFPTTHKILPSESCLQCHQVLGVQRWSPIPHSLEGREDCLACHRQGGLEPSPPDHEGRTNESCLLCHRVAGEEEDDD